MTLNISFNIPGGCNDVNIPGQDKDDGKDETWYHEFPAVTGMVIDL